MTHSHKGRSTCSFHAVLIAALLTLMLVLTTAPLHAAEPPADQAAAPEGRAILGNDSIWRCHFVNRRPLVRVDGELQPVWLDSYNGVWRTRKDATDTHSPTDTPVPPADWTAADFDDLGWGSLRGPFFPTIHGWAWTRQTDGMGFLAYDGATPDLAAICVRGRFVVDDPAKAGEVKLSLAYRGGIVVYVNGQEVARADIPEAGKGDGVLAMAADYSDEVFVKGDGEVIRHSFNDPPQFYDRLKGRIRRLENVTIPARLLRKGPNVLALEAHRSPYNEVILGKGRSSKGYVINWATTGIVDVDLRAGGSGVQSNAGRPAGVQVWNQETDVRVGAEDYGNPCEALRPIRLVGARNGTYTGQVVVGSAEPLTEFSAVAGDLTGPGVIPASALQVRYALSDPDHDLPYEVLSPTVPDEIAVVKDGGAVMPIWVSVRVPPDAKAGDYSGQLTITVGGAKPMAVPVTLRVVGWTLPDPKEFVSHVGLTQSPESVAMRYKVELWSEEHWKLLDEVFALMGQAGADDLFLTAMAKTHFGNEHAMIRRVRNKDGSLGVDLSIAEKYLDLAIKHLGKVPVVCVYGWEPLTGSVYGGRERGSKKGVPYTLLDPSTGKLSDAEGPTWGSPESQAFWKPVLDGVRELLAKRGMAESLMIGIAGDSRPTKEAVEDLKAVAPDARWVIQSHMTGSSLFGQPVGYLADVWGSPRPPDPAEKRVYGWQEKFLRVSFPRAGSYTLIRPFSPLAQYRLALEMTSTAGIHGFGRVGADFWNVLQTRNKTYGKGLSLIAHYPQSDWGQLYLGNSTAYVLAPGPRGPLSTVRFEMIREGAQDVEARVFIEKALLDPAARAKVGDDLADRCQQLLDDRVRAMLLGRNSWLLFTGGEQRREQLYELAAQVANRLGK